MAKKDEDLRELPPGVEVTLILTEVSGTRSRSGERRRVVGVGRGRVVSRVGLTYRVKLEESSERHLVGKEVEEPRGWLYAIDLPDERRAFEEAVRMFWREDRT